MAIYKKLAALYGYLIGRKTFALGKVQVINDYSQLKNGKRLFDFVL